MASSGRTSTIVLKEKMKLYYTFLTRVDGDSISTVGLNTNEITLLQTIPVIQ